MAFGGTLPPIAVFGRVMSEPPLYLTRLFSMRARLPVLLLMKVLVS